MLPYWYALLFGEWCPGQRKERVGSTVSVVSLTSGFCISDRRFFYVLNSV